VIALQKNLAATADAHQLMADFLEAGGGIAGAGEHEDGEREQTALQQAAEGRIEFRHHSRFRISIPGGTGSGVPCAAIKKRRAALGGQPRASLELVEAAVPT
jgi:hypothetical protein